ncbi:MAG: type II toxin-antitoxin system HicA family toxin [Chloroflexota bacterium]
MTEIPSLPYRKVINALQRAGFVVIRQRGSHIRLQKRTRERVTKITVPAHPLLRKLLWQESSKMPTYPLKNSKSFFKLHSTKLMPSLCPAVGQSYNEREIYRSSFSPFQGVVLRFPKLTRYRIARLSIVRTRQTEFEFFAIMRLRLERGKYAGKDRNLFRR